MIHHFWKDSSHGSTHIGWGRKNDKATSITTHKGGNLSSLFMSNGWSIKHKETKKIQKWWNICENDKPLKFHLYLDLEFRFQLRNSLTKDIKDKNILTMYCVTNTCTYRNILFCPCVQKMGPIRIGNG